MTELPVPIPNVAVPATQAEITYPVHALDLVLRACNPGKPLETTDPRRADLSELRGSVGIWPLCRRLIMQLEPGEFHHGLLCGHRGSGKSTELLALQEWANNRGFLAVWTEVNERYGMIELDYSDLFLLTAVVVERAMAEFGHPLPAEKIRRVIEWFRDITVEDAQERRSEIGVEVGGQLGGTLPLSLGNLFAKLTASFKGTSAHAERTRQTLRRYPDTLIDFTNDLLQSANRTLQANGRPRGLLLLMDNLDRYDPANVDAILVRSSHQMRQLACHALFTFPISLAYKPISGRMSAEYGLEVVLPMLSLRPREAPWADSVEASVFDEERVSLLRAVLSRRVEIETLFTQPADADLLIKMSGGAIRDLVQLVTVAATYTEDPRKITSEAVQSALNDLRATYVRFLTTTPHDYRCLAALAQRKSMVAQKDDYGEQINRLLFNGCLLEYWDGSETWHDVHPVLVDTLEFRDACHQTG